MKRFVNGCKIRFFLQTREFKLFVIGQGGQRKEGADVLPDSDQAFLNSRV